MGLSVRLEASRLALVGMSAVQFVGCKITVKGDMDGLTYRDEVEMRIQNKVMRLISCGLATLHANASLRLENGSDTLKSEQISPPLPLPATTTSVLLSSRARRMIWPRPSWTQLKTQIESEASAIIGRLLYPG